MSLCTSVCDSQVGDFLVYSQTCIFSQKIVKRVNENKSHGTFIDHEHKECRVDKCLIIISCHAVGAELMLWWVVGWVGHREKETRS